MTRVLVLNAGSSGVKWSLLSEEATLLASGNERWTGGNEPERRAQIRAVLTRAEGFDVVGHRLVHGGRRFREAVRVDADVRADLEQLVDRDPQHMRVALAGIDAVRALDPSLPQVAAFDTAFHATLPEPAAVYALPFDWSERWQLRRFGFHGLSVSYAVARSADLLGETPARMVVCHLGSGCSLTAVKNGRSVDTTMGFTPLEGVMMGTRSGSVDPGLLLYLQESCGVPVHELREALTYRSGLLGVSGVSSDLRDVLEAADARSERAQLAYDAFVRSVRGALGAMLGVLGGVDAVVFTGGIGENSARLRRDVAASFTYAGIELDVASGDSNEADYDASAPGARVRTLVVHAREDLSILREVLRLL